MCILTSWTWTDGSMFKGLKKPPISKKPSAVSGATVEPAPATPPVQEPQAITEKAMLNYMVQNPEFLRKFKVLLGVGN